MIIFIILPLLMFQVLGLQSCQNQLNACDEIDSCYVFDCTLDMGNYNLQLKNVSFYNIQSDSVGDFFLNATQIKVQRNFTFLKFQKFDLKASGNIFLYSGQKIQILEDSLLQSFKIGLFSGGDIILESTEIITQGQMCNQKCDCLSSDSKCEFNQKHERLLSFLNQNISKFDIVNTMAFYNLTTPQALIGELVKTNYSIALVSQGQTLLQQSIINGSRIGIYSENLVVKPDSLITSKGKGCPFGQGFGCAFSGTFAGSTIGCGGAGGSYGNQGGSAVSNFENYFYVCYNFQSRQQYPSFIYPILEGSGGGGTSAGSGGGIVIIESLSVHIDGFIEASGNGPYDQIQQDTFSSQGSKGGGSGGSIQIHTDKFHGTGQILSNGGGAPSEIRESYGTGGPGSGGRVLINITKWWSKKTFAEFPQIHVQGGKFYRFTLNQMKNVDVAEPNLNGSIYATICPPGFEINQTTKAGCVQCPPGWFKFEAGPQLCKKCRNDDGRINFTQQAEFYPSCRFDSCKGDYNLYAGECLTLFEKCKKYIGGEVGISILIVCFSVLLMSVIVISIKNRKNNERKRKRTQRDLIPAFDPSSLTVKKDESSAKAEFIIQDLPYHVRRLFLQGENTLENPWFLHQDSIIIDHVDGVEPFQIEEFILKLNRRARYSRILVCLMNFFNLVEKKKVHEYIKLHSLSQDSNPLNKNIQKQTFNTNKTGYFIKFTASPDQCLAFIDVLNYRQDPLEWNNQTKFPVSLVLAGLGSFLFPIQIYQRDPLVRSLDFYFQNKRLFVSKDDDDSDEEEKEEDEVNDVASFDEFIAKFNYLSKFIDFQQTQSRFIQNFKELISFVEYQNEEIFKNQGISIDLCVHLIANEVKFPNLQSKIIMLSKLDQDLYKTLKEVHQSKNYGVQWETRFSINFEKHAGPIDTDLYTDQVVLVTQPHLNAQIEEYKLYEDEREELNNLKLKMIRRMDRNGQQSQGRIAINYINTIMENEDEPHKLTCAEYLKQTGTKISRIRSICFSYYIRCSPPKFNMRVIITLIILCCIIQLAFAVVYPTILAIQLSQTIRTPMLWLEIVVDIGLFPLSWLIAPIMLCYWGMTLKTSIGKKFMVVNYCVLIWSIVEFFIGTIQLFEDISRDQATLPFINLVKMGIVINTHAMAFLSCFILNHNNYNSMVQK